MKAAIESLELDLVCIEHELKNYYPPIPKFEAKRKELLQAKEEIETALMVLKLALIPSKDILKKLLS